MKTQYFSFFGSVECAAEDSAAARALAVVEIPTSEDQADWRNQADYWLGQVYQERLQSLLSPRGEMPRGITYEEGRDGIETVTWQYGDGSAVLVVASTAGRWAEVGAVCWPLQFTAPAAVAGACCAPRYGLEAARA